MDQRGRAETFTSSSVSVSQQQQPQQQPQQQRPAPVQSVYRDRSLAARENNKTTNRFSCKYPMSNTLNSDIHDSHSYFCRRTSLMPYNSNNWRSPLFSHSALMVYNNLAYVQTSKTPNSDKDGRIFVLCVSIESSYAPIGSNVLKIKIQSRLMVKVLLYQSQLNRSSAILITWVFSWFLRTIEKLTVEKPSRQSSKC